MNNTSLVNNNHCPQFYYDNSCYYSYVLVNGSRKTLRKVIQHLQSNQIICKLTGKSHKKASDGNQYQWYIRVSDNQQSSSQHPPDQKVNFVLKQLAINWERQLSRQNKLVSIESSVLTKQLLEADKEIDHHKLIVNKQKEQLSSLKRELSNSIAKSSKLIEQRDAIESSSLGELELLEHENETQKEEITHLFAENLDLQEQTEKYAAQLNNEKFIRENLESKISELERQIETEQLSPDNNGLNEVEFDLIKNLVPTLQLVRGSNKLLFSHEVKERAQVLSVLHKLEVGQKPESKRVQTADSWWEISQKINFGDGGARGRMYYRRSRHPGFKYDVIISYKKFQQQDINWMKNN